MSSENRVGRPSHFTPAQAADLAQANAAGVSVMKLAKKYNVGVATIHRAIVKNRTVTTTPTKEKGNVQ